jgi:hypothetical protein
MNLATVWPGVHWSPGGSAEVVESEHPQHGRMLAEEVQRGAWVDPPGLTSRDLVAARAAVERVWHRHAGRSGEDLADRAAHVLGVADAPPRLRSGQARDVGAEFDHLVLPPADPAAEAEREERPVPGSYLDRHQRPGEQFLDQDSFLELLPPPGWHPVQAGH